jgi:hypothetical protein
MIKYLKLIEHLDNINNYKNNNKKLLALFKLSKKYILI